MKQIRKYNRRYNLTVEEYQLTDMLLNGGEISAIGSFIAYLVITSPALDFVKFYGYCETGHSNYNAMVRLDEFRFQRHCNTSDSFQRMMRERSVKSWKIRSAFRGAEIISAGNRWGNCVTVSYSPLVVTKNDVQQILSDIEYRSYFNHCFDPVLVERIKRLYSLDQVACIKALLQISRFEDIYREFSEGVKDDGFAFPDQDAVTVEDWNAERLHEELGMPVLDAYQRLVWMRIDPDGAGIRLDEMCRKK